MQLAAVKAMQVAIMGQLGEKAVRGLLEERKGFSQQPPTPPPQTAAGEAHHRVPLTPKPWGIMNQGMEVVGDPSGDINPFAPPPIVLGGEILGS